MHRLASLALVALLLAALAACGGPNPLPDPDPDPTPALTLTGVVPATALPGANVVLQGTGFEAGQAVTFDGVAATVTNVTATAITVTVPATYGYPVIAVEDVAKEKLLFVGTDYAGDANLDALQAALDLLPENAALRLPAGIYATPGTSLDLDNRKLYGAGAATVLEVTDRLLLVAQGRNVTVLEDLKVDGGGTGYARVERGRLVTAEFAFDLPSHSGMVVLASIALETDYFESYDDFLAIVFRDAEVTVDQIDTEGQDVHVLIERSDFIVADYVDFDHDGSLYVFDSTFEVTTSFDVYIDHISGLTFERSTIDAGTYIDIFAYESVSPFVFSIHDSTLTAGTYIDLESDDASLDIVGSTLTAGSYVSIDGDDYGVRVHIEDSMLTAGSYVNVYADGGAVIVGSTLDGAIDQVYIDVYGVLQIASSTLRSAGDSVGLWQDYGHTVLEDVTIEAATYVDMFSYGPITVVGGSLEAGTYVQLYSSYAGEITVRDTTAITAGTFFGFYDGSSSYAGNNGIFTFEGNAATSVGDFFELFSWYADLVVRGNGPIEAGGILNVYGVYGGHVTVADNGHIEAGGDIWLYAAGSGGRLAATNNTFVANAGAGTIILETQPGELTQSGNTFTGTLATPGN